MDHLPMRNSGRWPDCALSSPVSKSPGVRRANVRRMGRGSYLDRERRWADTIRVQPNYPQLSRRNLPRCR